MDTIKSALVHSTAEYCAPAWCRDAHTHLIDLFINNALRIVTAYRPTPSNNLLVLEVPSAVTLKNLFRKTF